MTATISADVTSSQALPQLPTTASASPGARAPSRDRYIDALRAVALFRVLLNHAFGWVWLTFVFPSMGVMFALAGSLAAASIDRSPHRPWAFMTARLRRLVPSLWALGVVLVPLMLWHGWSGLHSPAELSTLVYWVLPVSDPPYSVWGAAYAEPLWYIRAYVWFILLSPAALWMFRRWPKRMLAAPLLAATLHGMGYLNLYGASARMSNIRMDLATYGACWLLGFAHHDGMLKKIPAAVVTTAAAAALVGTGTWWALTHPSETGGVRIDSVPFAQTLYCLGWVLFLLRFYVSMDWIARVRLLDHIVSTINARAVTIYLWSNVAIGLALTTVRLAWPDAVPWSSPMVGRAVLLSLVIGFLILAVMAFGWVEDIAARRQPSLLPARHSSRPRVHPVAAAAVATHQSGGRPIRLPAAASPGSVVSVKAANSLTLSAMHSTTRQQHPPSRDLAALAARRAAPPRSSVNN